MASEDDDDDEWENRIENDAENPGGSLQNQNFPDRRRPPLEDEFIK